MKGIKMLQKKKARKWKTKWKALQGVPINGAQSIFKETMSQQSMR
jgi:hypothetical protein